MNKPLNFSTSLPEEIQEPLPNGEFNTYRIDPVGTNHIWIYPEHFNSQTAPIPYVVRLTIPWGKQWGEGGIGVECRYALNGLGEQWVESKTVHPTIRPADVISLDRFKKWLTEVVSQLDFETVPF
jgi:hypothetical protein